MDRLSAAGMVGLALFFQSSFAGAQSTQIADLQPAAKTTSTSNLPELPPMPPGRATVMGGVINNVDPVRDEFKLKVFGGGHPVKMLFDARTQVFRDGKRVPIADLRSGDHASVETTLDGSSIFALRVHMLSRMPQGDVQGQVLSYNPSTGELTLNANLSRQPIKLQVPSTATIVRQGQTSFASERSGVYDLVNGTLISVKFSSGNNGRGVVDHIAILATPGASFAFSGQISFLDASSGRVTLVNSTDGNSYVVYMNPSEIREKNLHEGQHVRVTAKFDGTRYVARALSTE